MRKKELKKYIILALIIIECISLTLTIKSFQNKNIDKITEENKVDKKKFAMYVNDGEGNYEEYKQSKFPDGYKINLTMSNCTDPSGNVVEGVLSGSVNTVTITSKKTVYCYIYFDMADVVVNVVTDGEEDVTPTTLGYKETVSCPSGTTATWNDKYNRLEISDVSGGSTTCTLTYTTDTSSYTTNYLNKMIMDNAVAGTTDGTGQAEGDIVNETFVGTDYVRLSASEGAYYSLVQGTSYGFTKSTTEEGAWVSSNKNVSSSSSVITIVPKSSGTYQLCYTMSSEQNYDYGIVKIDGTESFNTKGANTDTFVCQDLGTLSSSNTIEVSYKKDGSVNTGNDQFIFYIQTTTVDTGYRYEGKSPNNYIWFNNELWRIIGVFETELEDGTTKNLTKIIRDVVIRGESWNKNGKNNWPDSSLNALLNGAYLNGKDGTNSEYCGNSSGLAGNCDYRVIGLDGTNGYYGSMIENVVWHLGGMSNTSTDENYYVSSASTWYTYERGSIVYSGNDTETTGYVGLMYPSDYGFSAKASSNCLRSRNLNQYSVNCAGESWLFSQGQENFLTHRTDSSNIVYRMMEHSNVTSGIVTLDFSSRPVVYLDSTVYVINGEDSDVGTITNPYRIGMK